jgi:sarcosine oxidase
LKKFDVIVVGCGAMGSSASYHLARKGFKVLCLEKFSLNHPYGSSHGKSRIIRTAYAEHPKYVPLVQRAFELWLELQRDSNLKILTMTGALFVGSPESPLISGAKRSARWHSLQHEVLTHADIQARFPLFHPDPDQIGIFDPSAGMLYPENCIAANVDLALQSGAKFKLLEPLSEWNVSNQDSSNPEGKVRVRTKKGEYESDKLVFASGSWLTHLVKELNLPLQCERQVLLWFRPIKDPQKFRPERMPIFSWWEKSGANFYGLPDVGDGVKVVGHHGGEITDPERIRREVTEEDIRPVREFLSRRVPYANGEIISSQTCMYTNTPDSHFLIDFHPRHKNVLLVSPCSGHGFKFSSVVGEIVSDLLSQGKTRHDISLFKIDRLISPSTNQNQ